MSDKGTFSESWYRIAGQHVALRPHVVVRRQYFRGERYYVLHDPFSNQFFRVRPASYEFIARLDIGRTVESVWHECIESNPEEAPGQEQTLRLLGQLHGANLLHSDIPPDTAKIFQRYEKRQTREARAKWLNLLFIRFPLFDPDALLKRLTPALRLAFSMPALIIWILVVGAGIKVVLDHVGDFAASSRDFLAPHNLLLLYVATILAKIVHELGHACACRRLGGEVHVIGIMLMIFTPLPYVDTTSSWAFRSRWDRAFVGAAGMIAELFLAAIAAFVWASTGDGMLHSIAFNIIFTASISTLIFNLNPLLRFDGYYILSDLLEIPNLQNRSKRQALHWLQRFPFGVKKMAPVASTRREAMWLGIYYFASSAYRLMVTAAILLFVAGQFLILGILLAALSAIMWIAVPFWNATKYLATSPALGRQRKRAVLVSVGLITAILAALFAIPAPSHFRAPGIVESSEQSAVITAVAGRVVELLATPQANVEKGQPLLRLENPELALEIAIAEARAVEAIAMRRQALEKSVSDLDPIDARIAAIAQVTAQLRSQEEALTVRSPKAGIWHAPDLNLYIGTWIPRGMEVGQNINPLAFRFSAVVSQEDASRLFEGNLHSGTVRLRGQAEHAIHVKGMNIIPAERRNLPSASLGWFGGGELAVSPDDSMREAREAFFEARTELASDSRAVLVHGLSGAIQFELPDEPLGVQWLRKLRQMLQRRFGV